MIPVSSSAQNTGRPAGGTAVVMSYWNPVLQYGVDKFARDLAAAGGAGMITPNLIPEEGAAWHAASDKFDLDRIYLAIESWPELAGVLEQRVQATQDELELVDELLHPG